MSADKIPQSVLVIDNDQLVQSMIKGYLTKAGTTKIVPCRNGNEALQAMQADRFDLIIMDWKLKQPTSPEMFKAIKTNPNTVMVPLVLSSGQFSKNDVAIFKKFPGTSFVQKPFSEDAFLMTVSKTHPGAHPKKVKEREKKKNSFAARLQQRKRMRKTNKATRSKDPRWQRVAKLWQKKEEMFHLKGGHNSANPNDLQTFGSGGDNGSGMYVAKGQGQSGLGLMHDKNNQLAGGNSQIFGQQVGGSESDLQNFANSFAEAPGDASAPLQAPASGWSINTDAPQTWGSADITVSQEENSQPNSFDMVMKAEGQDETAAQQNKNWAAEFNAAQTAAQLPTGSDLRTAALRDEQDFAAAMQKAQQMIPKPASGPGGGSNPMGWQQANSDAAAMQTQDNGSVSFGRQENEYQDASQDSPHYKGNAFAGLFDEIKG